MAKGRTTRVCDVLVIGGGSAGFAAASAARQAGASVVLIERELLGGECPNWACVPTKAMLRSAKAYYHAKHDLERLGVYADGVTFNFSEIMNWRKDVVEAITGKGKKLERIAKDIDIDVVHGVAEFTGKQSVKVGGSTIEAKKIILATGANDFIPPIAGVQEVPYLTFRGVTELKKQPQSVAIIGAGPVGCEFATFFGMLGTKVHLLQLTPVVLEREDEEIGAITGAELIKIGVSVHTNTKTLSMEVQGGRRSVTFQEDDEKRQRVLVDHIIIAAGKRTRVAGLNLKKAEVKLDDKGRLVLDAYLRTSNPAIFAAGDVAGGMMFTHTAHAEGAVAGWNATRKGVKEMKTLEERVVPRVTFTDPEVASVGITAKEASTEGRKIQVARVAIGALGRAVTDGKRTGLLKIVFDASSREVLGGHMAGECAGEVIHELALAIHLKATIDDLDSLMHAFPTYSEAIAAAAGSVVE